MVDIREYYDAGGEMKPGKKGKLQDQAFLIILLKIFLLLLPNQV